MDTKKNYNNISDNIKRIDIPFDYKLITYNQPISLPLNRQNIIQKAIQKQPEILVITSFPPRECGIATYSQDLIKSLNNIFSDSFSIKISRTVSLVSNTGSGWVSS